MIILTEYPSSIYNDDMGYTMENSFKQEFQTVSSDVQINLDGTIKLDENNKKCENSQITTSNPQENIDSNIATIKPRVVSDVIKLYFVQDIKFNDSSPFQIAGLGFVEWMFSTIWFNKNVTSDDSDFFQVMLVETVNGSTWEVSNYKEIFLIYSVS